MYCTNCGIEIRGDANFCSSCGKLVCKSLQPNTKSNLSKYLRDPQKAVEPKIPSYIILSVIGVFLFLFTGAFALYFSMRVRELVEEDNFDFAKKMSRAALFFGLLSIFLPFLLVYFFSSFLL